MSYGRTSKTEVERRRAEGIAGGQPGGVFHPIPLHYRQLKPNLIEGTVESRDIIKKYEPVITKGMIIKERIVPFGYFNPNHTYSQEFKDEFFRTTPSTCIEDGIFDPKRYN
jgi:hypothetical protein